MRLATNDVQFIYPCLWFSLACVSGVVALTYFGWQGVMLAAVERYVYEPYGATRIEKSAASGSQFAATTTESPGMVQGEFARSDLLDSRKGWESRFDNPYLWTGQRFDAGSNTHEPSLGRWFQCDPAGYIDAPNLYQYVSSSPAKCSDPLGLALITDPLATGFSACPDPGFGDPLFPIVSTLVPLPSEFPPAGGPGDDPGGPLMVEDPGFDPPYDPTDFDPPDVDTPYVPEPGDYVDLEPDYDDPNTPSDDPSDYDVNWQDGETWGVGLSPTRPNGWSGNIPGYNTVWREIPSGDPSLAARGASTLLGGTGGSLVGAQFETLVQRTWGGALRGGAKGVRGGPKGAVAGAIVGAALGWSGAELLAAPFSPPPTVMVIYHLPGHKPDPVIFWEEEGVANQGRPFR